MEDYEVLLGLNWFEQTGAGIFPSEKILRFPGHTVRLLKDDSKYETFDDMVDVLLTEVVDEVDKEDESDWETQVLKFEPSIPLDCLQLKQLKSLIKKNRDMFALSIEDLGECAVREHIINLIDNSPIFLQPYRKSASERNEIQKEINKMLKARVIRPSKSAWSAQVIMIPKKDGTKRMCIDYRKLNAVTKQVNWPLPVINDIFDRLSGSKWFSALDLKSSYLQVKMSPDSIEKTAFSTPDGNYEFLRLPFCSKNAPADFSGIMNQVLGNLNFVEIVGHIVSKNDISMDPAKIEAKKNRVAPKNVKQLQQFIGLCNYYRRFIKDFAKIATPLFKLLQKDLVSRPTLRLPDLNRPFILYTDSSGYALGAILTQKDDDGNEYVCAYASRILKNAEVNYGITEKECLAVVWAIKFYRVYLYGTHFKVITDHSALAWLIKIVDPTARLARWKSSFKHRCSRPVLSTEVIRTDSEESEDNQGKTLDPWEDEVLLHFLRYGKYPNGISKKTIKPIKCKVDNFKLENEILYYRKDINSKFLIWPKKAERRELITKAHLFGHFQAASTYDKLKENNFWKNMINDVINVVRECITCQRHQKCKILNHPAQALKVDGIFARIGIDLVFGLPVTEEGYKGIMVITEYLSKFPYAEPIKSKSREEIVQILWRYISLFGPTKIVLSDQGIEFNNKLVDGLIRWVGAEHKITSAYNPPTNGLTERFNQTLIESLRKHAETTPNNWDK
ncbi:unnamed protein product [Brachionus calyciflorus]|uniref:Integrase catalytic domain-containing protein n=1 Tax=Brachionus calyciflorus TaxID=104777 RepID=A0A814PAC5_9BILA|nr:unnamed protein product [Brachionus calyciflorus]